MKRAARIFVMFPPLVFALLIPLVPRAAHGQSPNIAGVLPWVNQLPGRRGLPELGTDPLLEQTAAAYAADLAQRGVLSHVDEQGRRVLERFHARGGTTVLVGEILGSGPDLASVTTAWEASPGHREVLCNPLWTHCGAAAVRSGGTAVWVVLFTSHRIDSLQITGSADGYLILGRLVSAEAEEPLLLSGVVTIDPLHWDPRSGEFSYLVSRDREGVFHRLGYRSQGGDLVVTNTFFPEQAVTSEAVTSGREREPR